MTKVMAAVAKINKDNPFESSEGKERPPLIIAPRDGDEHPLPLLSLAGAVPRTTQLTDTPRFVIVPIRSVSNPSPGTAQSGAESTRTQLAEGEPASGTNHVPSFDPVKSVILVPTIGQPSSRFQKLQEYEGEVLSIDDSSFVARLIDLTDKGAQRLEATFSIDNEVSLSDRPLLIVGAVFYWIIGFKDHPDGQRKTGKFSEISPIADLEYARPRSPPSARRRIEGVPSK